MFLVTPLVASAIVALRWHSDNLEAEEEVAGA
jgi:hypothetical protein